MAVACWHTSAKSYLQRNRNTPRSTELLAIHHAIRHISHMLEGWQFLVQTDHQPLVHAFTKKTDCWLAISKFSCIIRYLKGSSDNVTDALSRNTINAVHIGILHPKIAAAQIDDVDLHCLRQESSALSWRDFTINDRETTIAGEMITGRPRPYLMLALGRKVFSLNHDLSNPSGHSTTHILTERYIWWARRMDIKKWACECLPRQTSKVMRNTKSGIGEFQITNCCLSHIHVDIECPYPTPRRTDTPSPSSTEIPDGLRQQLSNRGLQKVSESSDQLG
ncbi:uncharacterized protein [Macrobrachium rosenbergii]|uniref:uncharacterized protein n=1 Tax=Macrobrachium rosenbergii TaxID=79674 RepID=UPI0034D502ED